MADTDISALERRISGFSFDDDFCTTDGRDPVSEDNSDLEDDSLYTQAARLEPGSEFDRPSSTYPDVTIDAKSEIRLVHLLPGNLSDDICCELTVHSLDPNKRDRQSVFERKREEVEECKASDSRYFEALSYTWGSWADFDCITLVCKIPHFQCSGVFGRSMTKNGMYVHTVALTRSIASLRANRTP